MPSAPGLTDDPAQPDALPTTTWSDHKDPAYTGEPAWTNLSLPRGWSLEKFAGRWNNNLASWAHHALWTFIKAEIKSSVWVILASFHLEGPAQAWWECHSRELQSVSWDGFIARLKEAFPPHIQQFRLRLEFNDLTFNGNYESYNAHFANLIAASDPADLTYPMLEFYYLKPLPFTDQTQITVAERTSMEQLFTCTRGLAAMRS